ncbi:unnamed protein product [Trichobilharzia regenti]|nr:unnamed protein product [Trichobilharzia regenti]
MLKRQGTSSQMKLFGSHSSFESKLLDSLWLIDSSIADINSESVRDRFYRLMEILKDYVNPALIMERFCEDTLENLSLIQSKQQFQTRYVRTKTRLFFKQQKFNLLREENEGYAKLITELCQISSSSSLEGLMNQIRSLIGYFDLDPNRVLDLILDEPGVGTPESLYKVSAFLIWKNLIDLDVLYGHVSCITVIVIFYKCLSCNYLLCCIKDYLLGVVEFCMYHFKIDYPQRVTYISIKSAKPH